MKIKSTSNAHFLSGRAFTLAPSPIPLVRTAPLCRVETDRPDGWGDAAADTRRGQRAR